jgi:hypothetical protein
MFIHLHQKYLRAAAVPRPAAGCSIHHMQRKRKGISEIPLRFGGFAVFCANKHSFLCKIL